jgi:translation initiation factor 2 subunit 3
VKGLPIWFWYLDDHWTNGPGVFRGLVSRHMRCEMKVQQQPEVNIGMVGHVDHGKTTLTKALSGEWTDRHSEEIKRGISIKLGYADTAFYKCPTCSEPECYGTSETCKACGTKCEFVRGVSFVDAPGHETLMATMLCGAAIMNGAMLLIAGNEVCPQPQTKEHLMALDIVGIKNIVVVQNKIDLVDEEKGEKSYDEILKFVEGTVAEGAPIIPVSAHHDANLDVLIKAVEDRIPTPKLDKGRPMLMYIARSFDVNRPGARPLELLGGVLGGSILQGEVKVDDELEIAPGNKVGKEWENLHTKATSLITGGFTTESLRPGGLIGIGTELDPSITKSDSMLGKVVGRPDTLPPVWDSFSMDLHLLERVVGVAEDLKVDPIKTNEPLMLNVGTATTVGLVKSVRDSICDVNLKLSVCSDQEHRIAVSRRVKGRWRLIGYGVLRN